MISNILYIAIILSAFILTNQGRAHSSELEAARQLFYTSVEDEGSIDQAIAQFETIKAADSTFSGIATTYIGSLYALKGKHAFLPHSKFNWVNKGLTIMDEGVASDPTNIESLFIHSSTCYFLPFFFNRGEDAQQKFRQILTLLPTQYRDYETGMLLNVIDFLAERAEFNEAEIMELQRVKTLIESQNQ